MMKVMTKERGKGRNKSLRYGLYENIRLIIIMQRQCGLGQYGLEKQRYANSKSTNSLFQTQTLMYNSRRS